MYSFSFTTSAVEGGEWSASGHGRDLPPERTSGTHCTGCWVGPRTGLDTVDISVSYCDFGFVFFSNRFDRRINETKFPTDVSFLLSIFYLSYN
jgi:hypothetical protein